MRKFEYKTITIGMCDYLDLNQLGNQGWEMCGVISTGTKVGHLQNHLKRLIAC